MAERIVMANDVELCTESFGDMADPAILLIQGLGASMLWWETGLCRMLESGRRFVIRYDHRDTGRSITYGRGHPGYTGTDLVADAAGVLAAYRIVAEHVVGVWAGGAFAQLLSLDHPGRVPRSSSSAPRPRCPSIATSLSRPRSSGSSCRPPRQTGSTPTRWSSTQ